MTESPTEEECEMLVKHDFTMIDPETGKLWKLRREAMGTKLGLYKHYKGPLYVVEGLVTDSTNSQGSAWKVLYWSTSHGQADKHVRLESEFHESVIWPDGKTRPRFCRVWEADGVVYFEPAFHILKEGLPLCGFTKEIPEDWPEGHKWIAYNDKEYLDKVTCPVCKKRA